MRRRGVLRAGLAGVAGVYGVTSVSGQRSVRPLGRLELPNAKEVVVDGTDAYVATGDGITVVDVADPANPSVRATRTDLLSDGTQLGIQRLWDVQVDGDRLVAAGPAQRGAAGANGAVLFDVSNPAQPTVLDTLETSYYIHNTAFDDGVVYLTANNGRDHPVVILSTSGDQFRELARWSLLDQDDSWEPVSDGLRGLHDVVVGGGIAYLLYWDAGTWILDVSDPAEPRFLGRLPAYEPADLENVPVQRELLTVPGNHHGGAISDDGTLFALGIEAWTVRRNGEVQGAPGGVELWDVTAPAAPARVATIPAPSSSDNTRGGGQFTTAHNCDIAGDQLYTAWYFGGVKRHDISDPAAPDEEFWWDDPERASFWTTQAVPGADYFVAGSSNEGGAAGAVYTFPDGIQSTRRRTRQRAGARQTDQQPDSSGSSGFGVAAAIGALGAAAWRLNGSRDESD